MADPMLLPGFRELDQEGNARFREVKDNLDFLAWLKPGTRPLQRIFLVFSRGMRHRAN